MKMNLIEYSDLLVADVFEGIPSEHGYYFPAEWATHDATWLSWPHNQETWPGKMEKIWPAYLEFIKLLSENEKVKINVNSPEMAKDAYQKIGQHGAFLENIYFYLNATNDAWCRDHGPAFLLNDDPLKQKIIVNWGYNAWGEKYPPFDLDNQIPKKIASQVGLAIANPGIIMEGGSVDFNGSGTLITSESCLLNPNRNPTLSKQEIELKLMQFYGVEDILWVADGIVGDDTDGHIDDTVRFVNKNTVITMIENDTSDENHLPLKRNRALLNRMNVEVIEIQMSDAINYQNQRLPASYANFYIANEHIIVPVFNTNKDDQALGILRECFPTRRVVGIDSTHLIWGFGSFHCLSQQEPS